MRVSYHEDYFVALPAGHPFPMGKFPALHQVLRREGLVGPGDVFAPGEAAWEDLRLVHTGEYLDRLEQGLFERREQRRLGLPWSRALVRRSRLAVGGTLQAARWAIEDGVAANLAGGTHHAFPDHGEGFCVLNDVAVAARVLVREGAVERVLVVDLDVHQGNGTAAALRGEGWACTFSMHGENNYPFVKERSWRDVGLPDGVGDGEYLRVLEAHLPAVVAESRPDLIFYLAGVDPLAGDRYGRLRLSRAGLRERERRVLEGVRAAGVPLVLLLSGGYAPTPEETAELHAEVHRVAREVYG